MVLRLGVGFRFFASNLKIMRNRDTFAHRDITHKASPGHVVGVQLQQTLKRKNRLGQAAPELLSLPDFQWLRRLPGPAIGKHFFQLSSGSQKSTHMKSAVSQTWECLEPKLVACCGLQFMMPMDHSMAGDGDPDPCLCLWWRSIPFPSLACFK